ncbi:hypothetical protein [Marinoscillum sp.]|uniref:hypothetical protein n=1 Tax=Marinoscillum sp. TaxID=2024838 RepID=UPI003BAADC11
MKPVKICILIIFLTTVEKINAQSTYLSRTSPSSGSAQLFFYDRASNGNTERNWRIATLPASTTGTGDKIQIELFGGQYSGGAAFEQLMHLGNRNGFKAYLRTEYGSAFSSIRIRAYEQSNGSIEVYFSLLSNSWKGASVKVFEGSGINNCTIYETPTNVGPSPSGTLVFDSFNDQAALTLNNSGDAFVKGKLGIGTETTGSHELAVEGSIGAREIKVEASGWSDFVFENDYELRTLEEVEQHINENGHLPEIPSEAEVAENGINLGEMDSKLLQKIEELTLYMIQMNKEMAGLKAKNEQLEKEVSALKSE